MNERDELREKYMNRLSKEEMVEAMTPIEGTLTHALSIQFADVLSLYYRVHAAHWNVVGKDFTEWHGFFGMIVDDLYGSLDDHAENIRKLGGFPPSDLVQIVDQSTIGMGAGSTEGDVLTADLHGANERVISAWKALFVMADAENEQGLANFAADRIDMHQKWAWQMRSHLGIM